MSVRCKAYLSVDDAKQPSEIRSFRLDEGAVSNYDYLRRKIATIFPNLGSDEEGKAFTLLWKDSTGDLITFSSDDELVEALGEVKDGVFRIYVNLKRSNLSEFPWQECVKEFWKSLKDNAQTNASNPCFGQPGSSQPYSRPNCSTSGNRCGQKQPGFCGSGPSQTGGCPGGFSFDAFPAMFPGFHAEVWTQPHGFSGHEFGRTDGNSAQNQEGTEKQNSCSSDKPSTSSTP